MASQESSHEALFQGPEEISVAPVASVPHADQTFPQKIHVHALDNLSTADLKAFATEHFPLESPLRVEWIDDTSANLVYETAAIASEALKSFSLHEDSLQDPLSLGVSKPLTSHHDVRLELRLAVAGHK